MGSDLSTIEESIKIALDAADAATDVTSEYNKVKREHKKLETSEANTSVYNYNIWEFYDCRIVAMIFSSVLISINVRLRCDDNKQRSFVIFAENVDDLKDNVKACQLPWKVRWL